MHTQIVALATLIATLSIHAVDKESSYIPYCPKEEINVTRDIPAAVYAQIVQMMPIPCVDVFVFDVKNQSYLMIQRTTPPGKDRWWIPGGRIFKGESFYESAVRKAKKEIGLEVEPIAQLGTYSTYFSESAWGDDVHTDTKNTVILALTDGQKPICDEHHQAVRWVPIEEAPTDPYLFLVYQEAKNKLMESEFFRDVE